MHPEEHVLQANPQKLRIMIVAADPVSTTEEFLEEEAGVITECFKQSASEISISNVRVFRANQLVEHLQAEAPNVVHFTGHGSPLGRVAFENRKGKLERKTATSLARIMNQGNVQLDGIVLNNCSAGAQQRPLLTISKHVISFTTAGVFDVSLGFSAAFYSDFARERRFESAYQNVLHEIGDAELRASLKTVFLERPQHIRLLEDKTEPIQYRQLLDREFSAPKPKSQRGDLPSNAYLPAPKASPEKDYPRKYVVWFGTNRQPLNASQLTDGFGTERDNKIHFGKCEVSIPEYHKIGSLGSPWWLRWATLKDDRLKVIGRLPMSRNEFVSDLSAFQASLPEGERMILLFVHGYNVSFDAAALRAAQIGFDLQVPGATAFFSWPSKGSLKGYPADEATIDASEPFLREFLELLVHSVGAQHLHVIAHSMGNRALLRTFQSLFTSISDGSRIRFKQIFLAAPDVDSAVFKQLAGAYPALSERTTLYVSSKDRALWGSKFLHDYPRAGYKPPITIVKGIDTVEVSNIDLSFLGHGYIGAARNVLHDMHSLLRANTPPDRRMGLELLRDHLSNASYWRIRH